MFTWAISDRESTITVMLASPGTHPDHSVVVATPLQSVVSVMLRVTEGGGSKLPRLVVNVTMLLHTGFSQESFTVAVMVVVSSPSARMASGARVMVNEAGELAATVILEMSIASSENPWA